LENEAQVQLGLNLREQQMLQEQVGLLQEELAQVNARETELQAVIVKLTKKIKEIGEICKSIEKGGIQW